MISRNYVDGVSNPEVSRTKLDSEGGERHFCPRHAAFSKGFLCGGAVRQQTSGAKTWFPVARMRVKCREAMGIKNGKE